MAVQVSQLCMDVRIPNLEEEKCSASKSPDPQLVKLQLDYKALDKDEKKKLKKGIAQESHPLRWYVALMGESKPLLSPLSADIAADDDYKVFRYDWIFGIAPITPFWWDWQGTLIGDQIPEKKKKEKKHEIIFQLIIDTSESKYGFSYVSSDLLALPPARNQSTWIQRNIKVLEAGSNLAAEATATLLPGSAKVMKRISQISTSLVAPKTSEQEWFIYQFIDENHGACTIEWQIDKTIMEKLGPTLRGSINLAFHGGPTDKDTDAKGIRLIARPGLSYNDKPFSYVMPTRQMEDEDVSIDVIPTTG